MDLVIFFILTVIIGGIIIPFAPLNWKGFIALMAVAIISCISSYLSIKALQGENIEYYLPGSLVSGLIPLRLDALSAWFILIINFTFITGLMYGIQYMKTYINQKSNISIHFVSYLIVHAALISICVLQNGVVFLIAWEIMALGSFLLVIFEHEKEDTIQAGINFLIQSHICVILLTIGFIFLGIKTNSFDFKDFSIYAASAPVQVTIGLFVCFFIGFSIKAGFFPFHTWLPYAHPAAPSHVSGVMSGVIIKIGIYGILRMILVIKTDYVVIGYIILFISVISGVYGVMLAILQHNLKKLLAYHSIENIGIIGIGIGIGCIGIGTGKDILIILGFAGALLHTLNHSLFKSLLFYGAGNVYQATHTMNIEQLGGLTKRMPHTSLLFLISALAICGLPPFNGFISEFLIYSGMLAGLQQLDLFLLSALVFSMFALVLIGGLALMCFTKAYGAVFLGTPRIAEKHIPEEATWGKLLPMYSILILMVSIGIFPNLFMEIVAVPVGLFSVSTTLTTAIVPLYETLIHISYGALIFLVLVAILYFIRTLILAKNEFTTGPTWGCGYVAPTIKMQYTASSFIRAYRKLAEPILSIHKNKKEISGIFPHTGRQETHPYDKAEELLIDYPIGQFKRFLNRFAFLQNGNPKFYILYGVTFILLVLAFPSIFNIIISILNFLNQ